jgi:hypothetical protein
LPLWVYDLPSALLALFMVTLFVAVSLAGLWLTRRFVLPRIRFHDGVNDAISGTVQAIGVFYGLTVGLIAVGVWQSYSNAAGLASAEAATIASLYRDVSNYAEPERSQLQTLLAQYTQTVIDEDWPTHRKGISAAPSTDLVGPIQTALTGYEPKTQGQLALHTEALSAFNAFIVARRLRIDAVSGGLSVVMWGVIWIGAAISIAVGYLFYIEDAKLHGLLIALIAAFLGIVVFVIIVNDRPFAGDTGLSPGSYQLVLDRVMRQPGLHGINAP